MKAIYIDYICTQLSLRDWQVENCVELFADGDTIPFISRYRKEKTGGLDDAQVAEIKHWVDVFEEMEKRKATILKTIADVGALTDSMRSEIESCTNSTHLEDLYLPFRPKRRTRATVAREQGLEPLADLMWAGKIREPRIEATRLLTKNGIELDVDAALSGARDIIAEKLSENSAVRDTLRAIYRRRRICSTVTKSGKKAPEADNYRSYFEFSAPYDRIAPHNLLAMLRGEQEGYLSVYVDVDEDFCSNKVYYTAFPTRPSPALGEQLREASNDAFKRLLDPSISKEIIREAKQRADEESIRVFGDNLRQLLLAAPLGQKRTLAIDPGFRNGCKLACLDEQGRLLQHCIIFPHPPQNDKIKSIITIQGLVDQFKIEAIALGNGTASRETAEFLKRIQLPAECKVWTVSENGASIYSASEIARIEFPNEDVTVRGAVSIGRRLMDPLSELVKIDPKNLGIGQYQHDVDQQLLKEKLDNTVESCVNAVGVNLNTASPYLLAYVAGIGPSLAANIVEYRKSKGDFSERSELMNVPRLGAKAFRQCAAFLRISGSLNPLDNSAVHPESYSIVDRMAASLGLSTRELVGNAELCSRINANDFVSAEAGLPTINDILKELAKPGRDPRQTASEFAFADDVREIEDLKIGMELPGIVTNITDFGAFIDIGLHENGLLHVSKLGPRGTVPSKVLGLHQTLQVRVTAVDIERRRISLEKV